MPDTPDSAFTPPGFTAFRADRCPVKSGKVAGGGICLLVNNRWCTDTDVISQSCSPDIETLAINCRPFYSPREFSSIVLVGVYTDPKAKKSDILTVLHDLMTQLENKFPNSTIIVTGDFNQNKMKQTLSNYFQHVDIPTHKSGNILDHCYSTIRNCYKAVARPGFGNSDHKTILLIPTYKSQLKSTKPTYKTVRKWTDDACASLQNCLETSDWVMFKSSSENLNEYTDVVTSYISFCYDTCVPPNTVKVKANDKEWVNKDFKDCMKNKFDAFMNNDEEGLKKAKYDIRKSVRRAKAIYGKNLEKQFDNSDAQGVWNGVQKITNYKKKI